MPQSKTNPDRARKLKKRRARNEAKTGYTYMLDVLRESLNNRFYEEQGFPHLEILAQNMQGCEVQHQDLSDYMQLQDMFIGFSYALSNAISRSSRLSMIEREDHVAGVAYALAATLLDMRADLRDDSGWMGSGVVEAIRDNWARVKFTQAGIPEQVAILGRRDLCCLFAIDFVMSFLDMTGEIAQYGPENLISVTNCKDALITAYTGFVTSNLSLVNKELLDFDKVLADNAVTEEFLRDYPDWKPEAADAFNMNLVGFNSVDEADAAFMQELLNNAHFMSDMRTLYLADGADAVPQGLREETVMGYVLRDGPRCKKAFAEGRDPTEEEMDRDAEVANAIIMQMVQAAQREFKEAAPEASAADETSAAPSETPAEEKSEAKN